MWTGPSPRCIWAPSEYAEAEFIAREISDLSRKGEKYEDMAVLYRTHTQARVLEEKLRMYGIPYRVFGGMSFYARKEIKDMVAYLTLLDNPLADTAFCALSIRRSAGWAMWRSQSSRNLPWRMGFAHGSGRSARGNSCAAARQSLLP